jgi:ADP-heptose:LPS heptosyltransferase
VNKLAVSDDELEERLRLVRSAKQPRRLAYLAAAARSVAGNLRTGSVRDEVRRILGVVKSGAAGRLARDPGEGRRFVRALKQDPENLKIAYSIFGGVGDALWSTAIIEAIKRKYPRSDLYVFVYRGMHPEVFRNNPDVAGVFQVTPDTIHHSWAKLMNRLLARGLLDVWYENKYQMKAHYGRRGRVPLAERDATDAAFRALDVNFNQFPLANNLVSTIARRRGMDMLQLSARSAALKLPDPQLFVFPADGDLAILPVLEELGDYITVHHGCDTNHYTRKLASGQQTKNWQPERWEAVIAHLTRTTSLKVVQLGTKDERPLQGAIHYFQGRTNVREAALLLKHARFHMDSEGGLVHLARAVHTPSLVLFGPTPTDFFGYSQNVNYKAGNCHDCWWSTRTWFAECPRGTDPPECMNEIGVGDVIRQVEALIEHTQPAASCRLERTAVFAGEPGLQRNWETELAIDCVASDAAPLKILTVDSGAAQLAADLANKGHDAHLCVLSRATDARRDHAAIADHVTIRFGAAFNLPYDDDAFDVVIATSSATTPRQHALRELVRVLRQDGRLALTLEANEPALDAELAGLGVHCTPEPALRGLVLRKNRVPTTRRESRAPRAATSK